MKERFIWKEEFQMSERRTEILEKEYSDSIPDDETTERPEDNEETYRDGSARHECWGNEA